LLARLHHDFTTGVTHLMAVDLPEFHPSLRSIPCLEPTDRVARADMLMNQAALLISCADTLMKWADALIAEEEEAISRPDAEAAELIVDPLPV
jgi:hypothetical protein